MRTVQLAVASALGCALGAGCTASADEVRPNADELYFPTGIVVAPGERVAFVANANSELRYDSGAISILDLDLIDQTVAAWTQRLELPLGDANGDGENDCEQDPDHSETLTCEEHLFLQDGGVRIGNFASDIAVQDLGGGNLRLIVPTRGDPSIAWADWNGEKLECGVSATPFSLCDDAHRLSFVLNEGGNQGLPEEPFGVFADSAGEFAMITHLSSGAVTLIDSPKVVSEERPVQITDVLAGIFAADPTTGLRGATGVAGRQPNAPDDIIYVGSRSEDRVQTFTVGRPVNGKPPFMLPGSWFFLDAVGGNGSGGSSDTRGMTFSADGSRLYLVNRRPPSLQVYDTSLGPTGFPKNKALGATDLCRQASTVAISGTGESERAYVTCFQDGQIYVVDPRGAVDVEDIILVGRGPYGVSAAPSRNKLFVTNFLEDTVAVIDTAPGSPTRNRVVLRIGKVRPL